MPSGARASGVPLYFGVMMTFESLHSSFRIFRSLLLALLVPVLISALPARSAAQAVTVTSVFQNHYQTSWPIGNQDCPSGYNIPADQYSSKYHLERGHAIHHQDPVNSANDYWVYWAHFEDATYGTAEIAIFKSTTECGPYLLQNESSSPYSIDGSGYGFQPGGWQSRDDNIFRDTNQTYNPDGSVASYASAYLVTASDSENTVKSSSGSTCGYANDSMAIFRMTSDYLGIDATANPSTNGANWVFVCDQREAPVILKSGSKYFLITSQAAGWFPSQGGYGSSNNMLSGWTPDPLTLGNSSTFGGQTSDGFEIQGTEANTYILAFDHLGGDDIKNPAQGEFYDTGGFLQPVILNPTTGTATLNWEPSWTVDNTTGVLTLPTLTNLAFGKTARSTILSATPSGLTTFVPDNAVDGLSTTQWSGSLGGSSAFAAAVPVADTNNGGSTTLCPVTGATATTKCSPSLIVDLGSVQPIQEIDLSFYMIKGSEPYYTYKIAYSSDDVNWNVNDYTQFSAFSNSANTNLSAVPFSVNNTYGFNFLPVNFSARYVALMVTNATQQNSTSPFYSPNAWEMAVIQSTAPATPASVTVQVTPPTGTQSTDSVLLVPVTVTGPVGQPTPTGYIQLTTPGYSSEVLVLVNGAYTFNIPAGALSGGAETLTVSYRPDPTSVPVYGTVTTSSTGSVTISTPDEPANIAATPVSPGAIGVSWSSSIGAASYVLKRSSNGGAIYTQIAAETATSYVDTGLTNGTSYCYEVAAVNSGGTSIYSSAVCTTASTAFPVTNLSVHQTATTQLTVSYTGVSGATSYIVNSSVNGGSYSPLVSTTGTSYNNAGLTNGSSYCYTVAAVFSTGTANTSSPVCETVSASVVSVPIPNYSFETPSTSSYVYGVTGGSWTFTAQSSPNGSGVTTNGSAFTASNSNAPAGTQVGFIQGTGSIYQTITGLIAGTTYQVTVSMTQRQNAYSGQVGNTVDFRVNGATITTFDPPQSSGAYADYTATFTAAASSATIGFYGTNTLAAGNYLDNTAFIDNIRMISLASISPANALVNLGNLTQTYSGSPEAISISTTPTVAGLNVSYTGIGSTTYGPTATAPTNPGTYSVSVTVVDPQYIGTANGIFTINQADPTVTLGLVAGSPTTTAYGTTVYFSFNSATVPQCPTGTVQLYVDSVATGATDALTSTSCTQPIQIQTATLTAGPHSVYARYSGDAYFLAESSNPLAYTVTQDGTTVTLATSSGTVNVGQPVTYTATVNPVAADNAAPPSGTVAFFDGTNQIGTGTLSTTAPYTANFTTSSLAAGPHSITATFTDTDGNFTASSSAIQTETVNLTVPTIKWTPAATTISYGTQLDRTELNATAVDGNGNPIAGTFSYNFPLKAVLGVGTANVTATFTPADPATYSSNSTTISFSVNPAQLTVTADSIGRNYGASNPTFTYQIAGFTNEETPAVVSGQAACSTIANTSSAPMTYPINCTVGTLLASNYTFSFVSGTLTVSPTPLTVTVNPVALTYGSSLPVLSGSVSGLTAGDTLGGSIVVTYSSSIPASSATGSYLGAITATVSGTSSSNYSVVVTSAALTINKASSSVAISANPNPAPTGTMEALTATVSGAGQLSGTVAFTSGATTLCSAMVSASGGASCTFVPSASGSLSIQAVYQGDANHLPSNTTLLLSVYNGFVQLHLSSTQLVYPGATNVTACVVGATSATATGTIEIEDGTSVLTSLSLQGNGCAYWYISPGLAAGTHTLTAVYSGDKNNPGGTSLPVAATVSPVPVNLSPSCWNSSSPYGGTYQCTISLSSNAGAPQGSITYSLDGAPPVTVPISNGNALFTLARPNVGNHIVVIDYAQQTNYAAARSQTETFTVTPAPTQIQLSPSSYYQSASSPLTLTALLTSWSAAAPQNGTVSFYAGSTLLGTLPAGASVSMPVSGLAAGAYKFDAVYTPVLSGDWAAATSSTVSVQLHN